MTDLFIDNKYTLWYNNIVANAKTFIVTDPQNNKYIVTGNLRRWCKENNVSFAALYMIFYNKRETTKGSVKGWKIIQVEQVT